MLTMTRLACGCLAGVIRVGGITLKKYSDAVISYLLQIAVSYVIQVPQYESNVTRARFDVEYLSQISGQSSIH